MPITITSTPGAIDANSFASRDEVNTYHATRIPLSTPWVTTGDPAAQLIITAQRMITNLFSGKRVLIRPSNGKDKPYYLTYRRWTGEIASDTQALPWPRIGMYDRYGRAIGSDVIPQDLKDAQAELAGLLAITDRTLDNDITVQGIEEIVAGPIELKFREMSLIDGTSNTLPESVLNMLVPSWYYDEVYDVVRRQAFVVNL